MDRELKEVKAAAAKALVTCTEAAKEIEALKIGYKELKVGISLEEAVRHPQHPRQQEVVLEKPGPLLQNRLKFRRTSYREQPY